jgi:hypothetical protein
MTNHVRRRYWIESAAAVIALVLLLVTIVSREWIEFVFGVDPDGGSGALEWVIVAGLAAIALAGTLAARYEVRRSRRISLTQS